MSSVCLPWTLFVGLVNFFYQNPWFIKITKRI